MIVVVSSVIVGQDDRYLLVEETKREAIGKFGLPGGKLEEGETLEQAAAREFEEETGLIAGNLRLSLIVQKPHTSQGNTVIRFIYKGDLEGTSNLEAELKYAWLSLEEILSLDAHNRIRGKDVVPAIQCVSADEPLTNLIF